MKLEQNVSSHETHKERYRQACEWLKASLERLESCVEGAGDKAAVQDRQHTLAVSVS